MKIILIRHAEPDYSIDSLTNKGWKEAEILAERIKKLDVKKFYVSPLGRARDTAKTALAGTGIEPEVLDWVREFEGRCINPRTKELDRCWDLLPGDWTKYKEMYDINNWVNSPLYKGSNVGTEYERVKKGLDALLLEYGYERENNYYIARKPNNDTIVIFCHMAVSLLMIGYLTGIAAPLMWHGFFAAPSTLFEIQTEEREDNIAYFRVRAMGEYSHLYWGNEPCSDSGFFV